MRKRPSARFLGLLHAQARDREDRATMKWIEAKAGELKLVRSVFAHSWAYELSREEHDAPDPEDATLENALLHSRHSTHAAPARYYAT